MGTEARFGPGVAGPALLRLLTWLSPSFPVGAYSYSHGLEYAVEAGLVQDRESLRGWVGTIAAEGSGRVDAGLLRAAHEAVAARDEADFAWALERADAWRASRELGVESEDQGRAFLAAVAGPWPAAGLDWARGQAARAGRPLMYPVAVGAAAAAWEIPLAPALDAYLHALAANLVSAGLRLIPLGQRDGQRILAALEAPLLEAGARARARPRGELGAATPMVDWASARHEIQYTRLFRS